MFGNTSQQKLFDYIEAIQKPFDLFDWIPHDTTLYREVFPNRF